jgi:anaerobic selenocysteine-containing dehydrogenase
MVGRQLSIPCVLTRPKPKRCPTRPNGMPITPRPVAQELRIKRAKAVPGVCPYCAVGYSTLVHVADGKILHVEGDPTLRIWKK